MNANFSQRCTPASAPLVGYVRFGATAPTPIPALPSTAEPIIAPAHIVTTSSNAKEFYAMGLGHQADFTGISVVVTGNLDRAEIEVAGWTVVLAPKTGEHLGPGTYIGAVRTPSASAPEISVAGPFISCNNDYGTFTVYQISADAYGRVTALNATFSQSCEMPTNPPLVGYIRFHATAPTPVPELPESTWSPPGAAQSP